MVRAVLVADVPVTAVRADDDSCVAVVRAAEVAIIVVDIEVVGTIVVRVVVMVVEAGAAVVLTVVASVLVVTVVGGEVGALEAEADPLNMPPTKFLNTLFRKSARNPTSKFPTTIT